MKTKTKEKMDTFFYYIKNLFWVLLVLQFTPLVVTTIKDSISGAFHSKNEIGLLKINTTLHDSSFFIKQIEKFYKKDSIKGLIISINSPGGMPGTAQALFSEVKKFKQKKPVIVVVENLCASAAYYVAAPASMIICNPSSLIGSIGSLMELPNFKELLDLWKVRFNYIQSGKYKTAGSPVKATNSEEIDYLQKLSDNVYFQFIKDVSFSRSLSEKETSKWADGKIFTGTQAIALKLVDKLGTIQDGIDEIKKMAKIEGEVKLIQPKRPSALYKLLSGSDDEDYGPEASTATKVATFASNVYTSFIQQQTLDTNINMR